MSNKFLLDLPEVAENDVIGFDVYVDDVIDAINSDARMIGLLANYGSGKSSVINMAKEKIDKSNVEFININLWKISEQNKNAKSGNNYDETIYIHKFLLRKLISYLPETSNKNYFENKINGRYSLFSISLKEKSDVFRLFLLIAFFIFNIIMKFEVGDFTVAKISIFVLDLIIALNFVLILSRAKLYLSFTKDSTNRVIDESDTSECFYEVIVELLKNNKDKQILICIEDLDRYNDAKFVIKVLEQIYKFYVEYNRDLNVKFLISLKQPYLLVSDHNKNMNNKFENNLDGVVNQYKELYEKLFDLIINLQTVSIQSFSSVVLGLISKKEKELKSMGIIIPKDDKSIGVWSYLYYGKNVSLRDIKHRFNYFIILYENLWRHKNSLEDPRLFEINLSACLFVSFLEDAYSKEFYELVNNPELFNKMVSKYLFTKEFVEPSTNNDFNKCISDALSSGLIKSDYVMYFYKYPNKRTIKNIFNSSIQNAIFTNSKHGINDFDLYCKNASKEDIIDALNERNEFHGIPSIIFENKILYKVAKEHFFDDVLKLLERDYVFSSENGLKNVIRILPKLYSLDDTNIIESYMSLIYDDLKINFSDDKITAYRKEIIKIIGLNIDLLPLFGNDMPLITYDESVLANDINIIFSLISPEQADESLLEIISFAVGKFEVKFEFLISFLDKLESVGFKFFKDMFYMFDYKSYSKLRKYQFIDKYYNILKLDDINEARQIVSCLMVLPLDFEKKIVQSVISCDNDKRKMLETTYTEIIMMINNISSETKNAILNFRFSHVYNERFEELLYEKKLYSECIYSKIRRTKMMSCEISKFDNLKLYYLNYFMSDSLFDTEVNINTKISNYIKENVSYENLDFRRIELLYKASQTVNDLRNIMENRYKEPRTPSDLKKYLRGIRAIADDQQLEFINYLINKVKNENFKLSLESYNCIRKLLSVNNVRRWQRIKRYCIR